MKTTTFIIFCMILCASIKMNYAQVPDWSRVLSSSPYEAQEGRVVAADNNLNVYMASAISGPVTFDGAVYTSVGKRDLLLSKWKTNGTAIWKKQINAQVGGILLPQAISVDTKSNIYLLCSFTGTVKIGNNTLISDAEHNAFIAKFNSNGNGVWATSYKYTGTGISRIALDGNNNSNVFVTSFSTGLLKFNSSGTKLWEQNYPDRTLQAIVISNNVLYLSGALQQGITTFGSIVLSSLGVGANTGFMIKGDLNGNFNKSFIINDGVTGLGSTSVSDMVIDKKGALLITGGYRKDLILGSVIIQNPDLGYYTYIAKCDKNFNFAWARTSTIFSINNLEIINYKIFWDNSGLIYQYGTHQFPFTYGAVTFNPNGGNQYLFKFDSQGNALAAYSLLNSTRIGTIVTPAGKVLSTGSYTYNGATAYGNLYITQRNNYLSMDWQKISSNSKSGFLSTNYVQHDEEGNLLVQSAMRGYCDYFGREIINNNLITLVAKHDISGNVLWVNQIYDEPQQYGRNGQGTRIIFDKDNNVLKVGKFNWSLSIGNFTLNDQNTNASDGYIVKYNSNGQLIWVRQLNAEGSLTIDGIASDTHGNVIISGEFKDQLIISGNVLNAAGLDGAFIAKFDPAGNCLWAYGYPIGENVWMVMVSTDGTDNVYLTGEMYNRATQLIVFGSVSTPQTNSDGGTVLVKFDANGNPLWVNTYGGVPGGSRPDNWPVDIKTDETGYSHIWGWCQNGAVFGETTLTSPIPIETAWFYYVCKIDIDGDVVWANAIYEKRYGFNYGDLLDLDENGNVYVGGQFIDLISINGNELYPVGSNDLLLAKYSKDGEFQWLKTVPANTYVANSFSVFSEDVLTLAAYSINDIAFDGQSFIGNGGTSGILATLGNLPSYFKDSNATTKSGRSAGDALDVQVYPNPSNGQFTFQVNTETKGKMVVVVYNSLGKAVKKLYFRIQSGISLEEIDISFLPRGTYTVVCKLNGDNIARQVVVE